jgi:hypothetical protein
VANTTLSKLIFAGLLVAAGAAQAGAPVSVPDVPASWYADRIPTATDARGAEGPVFPTASYEHGPIAPERVVVPTAKPQPSVARSTSPFPSSPNETGSVL